MSIHDKEEAAISAAETTADTLQRFPKIMGALAEAEQNTPPAPMVTEAKVDAALAAFEHAGRYASTRARIKAALIAAQEKGR